MAGSCEGGQDKGDCTARRKIDCKIKQEVRFGVENSKVIHLGKNNPIFTSWSTSKLAQGFSETRPSGYGRHFHEYIT